MAGRVIPLTAEGAETYGDDAQPRKGFFTDTSVCIGCKACEVACKEWNDVPADGGGFTGMSYDNTEALGANTWRHVAFVEQRLEVGGVEDAAPDSLVAEAERQRFLADGHGAAEEAEGVRWLMSSDVCKHCTRAGCLDACPTGAIFRTEFGTVVVQEDVCNGCGYCVVACPFGVLDRRESDGRVWKCTLCYDRIGDGLEPACAKACPTDSIKFGPLDELLAQAGDRLEVLEGRGESGARLYGADPEDGVGGFGAFFLLLDEPEAYGLPPDPVVPTTHLGEAWTAAGVAMGAMLAGVAIAVFGRRR